MRFLSLFAGVGGFDLGLERAGWQCVGQVEIDPFCRKVLAKHWPNVWRHGDVRTVTAELIQEHCGSVDAIVGGFPCQPFSSASAGKQKGQKHDSYLWPEMFRVISEVRPRWVFAENVTHIDRLALSQVVSNLEAIGYEIPPLLEIPACAVGHDHKRARIWILGYANGDGKSRLPINAKTSWMQGVSSNPGNLGTDDGISGRLDRHRLKALGNAVVPQIPEIIGRAILQTEAA